MTIKEIDQIVVDANVDKIISGDKAWLCPVCGVKRNIGDHQKCSKITQLKHQKERELADKIKADQGQKGQKRRKTG